MTWKDEAEINRIKRWRGWGDTLVGWCRGAERQKILQSRSRDLSISQSVCIILNKTTTKRNGYVVDENIKKKSNL